jgi:hypothetical protein
MTTQHLISDGLTLNGRDPYKNFCLQVFRSLRHMFLIIEAQMAKKYGDNKLSKM